MSLKKGKNESKLLFFSLFMLSSFLLQTFTMISLTIATSSLVYDLNLKIYQNDLSTILTSKTYVTINNGTDYTKPVSTSGWVNFTGISSTEVMVKAQWENSTPTNGWVQVNGSDFQKIKMGTDKILALYLSVYKDYILNFQFNDGSRMFSPNSVNVRVHNGSNVIVPTRNSTYELKGWWKLDENKSARVNDSSGNGNTGTLGSDTSAPLWVIGKFGSALQFDGIDDLVVFPDSQHMKASIEMTLEAWIKPKSLPPGNHHIISKWGEYAFVMNGMNLEFGTFGDNIRSKTDFYVNEWYFVVAVWKQGRSYELYINGRLDNSAPTKDVSEDRGENLYLGASNPSIEESYFNGIIDNVKIYHRALTAKEIELEYYEKLDILKSFVLPKVANGTYIINQIQFWNSNVVPFVHPVFFPTKDFDSTTVNARIYSFSMINMRDQDGDPFSHTLNLILPNSTSLSIIPDEKGNIGPLQVVNGSVIISSFVEVSSTIWYELASNYSTLVLVSSDTIVDNYVWIRHGDESPFEEEKPSADEVNERIRYAAKLDGRDAYIILGNNPVLQPTSVTVAVWVYEPLNWPNGGFAIGVFTGGYRSLETYGYMLQLIENGAARWVVGNGTKGPVFHITSGRIIQPKTWTLIVGEFDSSSSVSLLYHDGSKIVKSVKGYSMTYGNSSGYIGLAFPPDELPNSPLIIYNVQIYNRSLDANELDQLYRNGVTGKPLTNAGLVGWWLTDFQKPSDLIKDFSGNQVDGVAHAEILWESSLLPTIQGEEWWVVLFSWLFLFSQSFSLPLLLIGCSFGWVFVAFFRPTKWRFLSSLAFIILLVLSFQSPYVLDLPSSAVDMLVIFYSVVISLLITATKKVKGIRVLIQRKRQGWMVITSVFSMVMLVSSALAVYAGRIDVVNDIGPLIYGSLAIAVFLKTVCFLQESKQSKDSDETSPQ